VGLIHPDVSKGTVSTLSLLCICVWHFMYCTASSSDVHGLGWCLFQTHSHLLHCLPTILHPLDLYLTTCFGMLPFAWRDYDWQLFSVVISVILTGKKIFPYIFTINFILCSPYIPRQLWLLLSYIFYIQYQECHREQTSTSEGENKSHNSLITMQSNRKPPYV